MFDSVINQLKTVERIVIIQGENPDGDSLGSSRALEEILSDQGKSVSMYCAIDMPKYLRYINGGDRVVNDFPYDAELAIIVDTAAETLLEKALTTPGVRKFLESHPVVVLDHHGESDEEAQDDLQFPHQLIMSGSAAATGEVVFELAQSANWTISADAAENIYISIAADTLGLTTPSATATTFQTVANLVKLGAFPANIELRRRDFMKKPADILRYKGQLIEKIEYHLDGRLATVHISWEEIQEYSDRYNPSVLVLDEMRLVEGVEVACAIKTYPDGKLTGKLRTNTSVAADIAGYFGGGGHSFAAGFKINEDYETAIKELLDATHKALEQKNVA